MECTITTYTITIASDTKTIADLTTLMDKWEENYIDYKYSSNGLMYYRFNPTWRNSSHAGRPLSIRAATNHGYTIYDEYPFQSGTNFDNIFFIQKSYIQSQ